MLVDSLAMLFNGVEFIEKQKKSGISLKTFQASIKRDHSQIYINGTGLSSVSLKIQNEICKCNSKVLSLETII